LPKIILKRKKATCHWAAFFVLKRRHVTRKLTFFRQTNKNGLTLPGKLTN
jgi:hypothetical protein